MRFDVLEDRRFLGQWRRVLPPFALLLGEIHMGYGEMMTLPQHEIAYKISAQMWLIVEEAREQLLAPTLPVHDEPAPELT